MFLLLKSKNVESASAVPFAVILPSSLTTHLIPLIFEVGVAYGNFSTFLPQVFKLILPLSPRLINLWKPLV